MDVFCVNKIAGSFQLESYQLNIPTIELKPSQGVDNAKNILRLRAFGPVIGILANIKFIHCMLDITLG